MIQTNLLYIRTLIFWFFTMICVKNNSTYTYLFMYIVFLNINWIKMINYHCLHNKSTKYFSKTNSLSLLTPLALVLPFKFFFFGIFGHKITDLAFDFWILFEKKKNIPSKWIKFKNKYLKTFISFFFSL